MVPGQARRHAVVAARDGRRVLPPLRRVVGLINTTLDDVRRQQEPADHAVGARRRVLDDALALDELLKSTIDAVLDARHLALLRVVAPVELALRLEDVRADVGRARAF